MLNWRVTGELLAEERRVGTKMILAGDDRHFASVERDRPFTDLSHWRGAAEISEITGPRADWQRITARDVVERRFTDAVPHQHQAALAWVSRTQGRRACKRPPSRAARPTPDARTNLETVSDNHEA